MTKAVKSPQRSLHRQALMEQSGGALFVQTSYVIFVTGPRDQKGLARQGRGHVGHLKGYMTILLFYQLLESYIHMKISKMNLFQTGTT